MAWSFGDGFDCYATTADMASGYWTSAGSMSGTSFVAGRFAGSQALQFAASGNFLQKTGGANDAVHHIICAFRQTVAISGTTIGTYFTLVDGAANQCSVVFRSDGAILLVGGAANSGTTLATYTGAFPVINTWYAFEIEVFISATAGYMNVRKNGNTSNDFASATNLNTRVGTSNAYANGLTFGMNIVVNAQQIDDLLWRSDASSVSFAGDLRCFTRMPASDAAVQFSRTPATLPQVLAAGAASSQAITAGTARYTPFTAAYDGTIGSLTVGFVSGYTGNLKCSIFASFGAVPTTVLGSANVLTNPATGVNTLTFATPVAVVKGTSYWLGLDSDTTSGSWSGLSGSTTGLSSATAYAGFPVASPVTTSGLLAIVSTATVTITSNNSVVGEAQQDDVASYVSDATPGHSDFYTVASITSTPSTVFAVTTRGYMQKNDAGSRTMAVQIKSGGTTVASPALVPQVGVWAWAWRTDTVDPNTGSAWTPSAVNAAQIGPTILT